MPATTQFLAGMARSYKINGDEHQQVNHRASLTFCFSQLLQNEMAIYQSSQISLQNAYQVCAPRLFWILQKLQILSKA